MEKLTFEEFHKFIMDEIKNCPENWRKGQSVFNIVDKCFGVAREVQFTHNVDCFYNDNAIPEFIKKAYEIYNLK